MDSHLMCEECTEDDGVFHPVNGIAISSDVANVSPQVEIILTGKIDEKLLIDAFKAIGSYLESGFMNWRSNNGKSPAQKITVSKKRFLKKPKKEYDIFTHATGGGFKIEFRFVYSGLHNPQKEEKVYWNEA